MNGHHRVWDLAKKYGMSPADVEQMLLEQDGKCAICRKVLLNPHVDHDHTTGEVRGLLCYLCNLGIGLLQEDVENLQNAITYLAPRHGTPSSG